MVDGNFLSYNSRPSIVIKTNEIEAAILNRCCNSIFMQLLSSSESPPPPPKKKKTIRRTAFHRLPGVNPSFPLNGFPFNCVK